MDFLKKLLEEGKISEDVFKALSEKFSKLSNALEELKKENETLKQTAENEVKRRSELEKSLEELNKKIQKAKEEGKNELVKDLEALKNEKENLLNALKEKEQTINQLLIDNKVKSVLSQYDFVSSKIVEDAIKAKVKVENGEVKYVDGENVLGLDEAIKQLVENEPSLLKSAGNVGSGASGGVSDGIKSRSEMSLEEKAAFIAQNGKEAYLSLPE